MKSFMDATTIYVKSDCGGKTNNGFSPIYKAEGFEENDGPVWSLEKAFGIVKELREGGCVRPLAIKMFAGEYCLDNPLVIDPLMSGVTVEPYGDGEVIISGGKKITGFREAVFNGKSCFAAYIPEVKDGRLNFTDLYVDGLRADFTRYPETGVLDKVEAENPGGDLFDHSKWFIAKKEDIKNFRNFEDCIISFCHYWVDEHTPVESYDKETGKLVMKYSSMFNLNHDFGYYIENVAETLCKPNEWYLDRSEGMLYYIPRDTSQMPDNIEARMPILSTLIDFRGAPENGQTVSNVRFRDITFAYTKGDYASGQGVQGEISSVAYASDAQAVSNAHGSINLFGASCCSVENCRIRNFGVHGITVNSGCSDIRITGSSFYDGGAGGIKLNGGDAGSDIRSRTHNCIVSDNSIARCGRRYLSACGILLMNGYDCEISHNEISDIYYSGISCGWVWGYTPSVTRDNLITKNHIYNIGQGRLSDMGGVYLLGSQPGTVVSNNLIHDIKCKEYGGWGLYTDEGSAGITIENNICYNLSSNGYHQHYGTDNVVRNNIFAFTGEAALKVSRFEYHSSITFENNIVFTYGVNMYGHNRRHIECGTVVSRGNLFFDMRREPVFMDADGFRTLSDIQKHGLEEGSVTADPKFRDVKAKDFTLMNDSPAFALGFKKIDMRDVGIRK